MNLFDENQKLREELEQEKRLHSEWQKKYYELAIELQKKSPVIDRAFFGFGLRQLNTEL